MEDILLHVFNELPLMDMYSCSLVNKQYSKVFSNLLLWKMKLDTVDNKLVTVLWNTNSLITFKRYVLLNRLKNKLIHKEEIGQLTNLQKLWLYNNQLTTLPAEIGQLTNLQQLGLDNNQITTLPAEIGQLTNLRYLSLYSNQLTTLPAEIGQLTNLQQLLLSHNQLTTLPAEIGQLTNLQKLDLRYNKLTTLPVEIG